MPVSSRRESRLCPIHRNCQSLSRVTVDLRGVITHKRDLAKDSPQLLIGRVLQSIQILLHQIEAKHA
jgi:hypothetical protein